MRQAPRRFTESEMRTALRQHLRAGASARAQVIEEMGIEHGAARIDIAVLDQGLVGYEIKSDFDTLDRLANQMHAYHRVFDALTLVTTGNFVGQVDQLLPPWWGIWQAELADDGDVRLVCIREAAPNPRQDAHSLLTLLWREEALTLLRAHAPAKVNTTGSRAKLYDQLAMLASVATIRAWVLDTLAHRSDWRSPSTLARSTDPVDAPSAPNDDWPRLAARS